MTIFVLMTNFSLTSMEGFQSRQGGRGQWGTFRNSVGVSRVDRSTTT